MRFPTVVSVASFLVLCALISFCAAPRPALAALAQSLSASGRIATVSSSKFTINLGSHQKPSNLDFVIDSDTKIEGALVVGAQAAVDYRADGERLVATHVVVLPASGIKP